jgi:hypothetical protein
VGGATPFLFRPSTGPFGSHPDVSFLRAIQQLFVAQPNFTGISQLTIHRTNLCEIAVWSPARVAKLMRFLVIPQAFVMLLEFASKKELHALIENPRFGNDSACRPCLLAFRRR